MSDDFSASATLVDLLAARAASHPEKLAFIFLSDGELERDRITYGQLHQRALSIGAHLQSFLAPGERVLLLLPSSGDFLAWFFGTLYAGLIAVPAYPAPASLTDSKTKRLQAMIADAQPRCVLTTGPLASRAHSLCAETAPDAALVEINSVEESFAGNWHRPASNGEEIAFLQYTSGSTARPKGVMVSHENVLQNERMIQRQCALDETSTVLSWLPPYHDMGLIGALLQPIYVGACSVVMSPSAFLQKPVRWLRAISKYRAYSSGGPNFAYDLCLARIPEQEREGLDLRSWRVAFNGAERVRPQTMERFSAGFEPYGFRKDSFFCCYGLAEATLIVAGALNPRLVPFPHTNGVPSQMNGSLAALASCGRPVMDTEVVIVDPDRKCACEPGEVGEIWVQSPSVARGYWNNPAASNEVFQAVLSGRSGKFLRTGDLGFLADGELVVTGRLKDLIIIRGQNIYPDDIELSAVESHPDLRSQPGAAFSAEIDGSEELIVIQGVNDPKGEGLAEIAGLIREAIVREHGIQPHTVVLADSRTIPRTSSGKVQRNICRAQFLAGALSGVLQHTLNDLALSDLALSDLAGSQRNATAWRLISQEIAGVLGWAVSNESQLLSERGLDSLLAVEIEQRLFERFKVRIPAAQLLNGMNLGDLARAVQAEQEKGVHKDEVDRISPAAAAADGVFALSLEQERLWALTASSSRNSAYNIGAALHIRGLLDRAVLQKAIDTVADRHQMLRAQFRSTPNGPVLCVLPYVELILEFEFLEYATPAATALTGMPFDISAAPLIRFKLLEAAPGDWTLLVAAHHLISDAQSFSLLFRDLEIAYFALTRGERACFKPLQIQPTDVARWQMAKRLAGENETQLAFWKEYLKNPPARLRFFDGKVEAAKSEAARVLRFVVPQALTADLKRVGEGESATLFMVLLAIWNGLLFRVSGQEDLVVATPVNGRDKPELRELIGCFAYPLVLRFQVSGGLSLREQIATTRDSCLRAFAYRQLSFAEVVELTRHQRGVNEPVFEVMFGFMKISGCGQDGSETTFEAPSLIRATSDLPLFVNLVERQGLLEGSISYRETFIASATADQLAEAFVAGLQTLAKAPDSLVNELAAPGKMPGRDRNTEVFQVSIAADFNAEPLLESLTFWKERLQKPWEVCIAPPGQAMQQFVAGESTFASNAAGANVLLLQGGDSLMADRSGENHLLEAMEAFQRRSRRPLFVFICPARNSDRERMSKWQLGLSGAPNTYFVSSDELLTLYFLAEDDIYDEFGSKMADVPFTRACYAALGTVVCRKVRALTDQPYKVVVLDCDETLWSGVCAEDGAAGVKVEGPWLVLQQFIAEQKKSGMLLCLCSKNQETDVVETFARQAAMPLQLSDFIAWRINWKPKWENLRSLADELHVGLDSFVFIDDNPLECAEVEAHCPEVLTVCLQNPAESSEIYRNIWSFDRLQVTGDDQRKTQLYREDLDRRKAAREAPSFEEFIEGLALRVQIGPMRLEEIARVAQLGVRVNQFNLTMRRYSEAELRQSCLGSPYECLTVHVKDRFGDYGLVGCVVFQSGVNRIRFKAFLLSCRALGRRVEWKMLEEVARIAQSRSLTEIEIACQITQRNQPAQQFVRLLGGQLDEGKKVIGAIVPVHKPWIGLEQGNNAIAEDDKQDGAATLLVADSSTPASVLSGIARELRRVSDILGAIDDRKGRHIAAHRGAVPPQTETEIALVAIWSEVLGTEVSDASQDFFALGGDSLLAVRILSRIWAVFDVEISLDRLFSGPLTVQHISRTIDELRPDAAVRLTSQLLI